MNQKNSKKQELEILFCKIDADRSEKYFYTINYEKILRKYYIRSTAKKYDIIKFHLFNILKIGISEVSHLSLWIKEVLAEGKEVFVDLPLDGDVFSFLKEYEFLDFLNENSISYETGFKGRTKPPKDSPIYPLKFRGNEEFDTIISDLKNPEKSNIILKEIKQFNIVKTQALFETILKELYQNVFIHTDEYSANFIMTRYTPPSFIKKYVPKIEKDFFNKIGSNPYIFITIADKGIGLYNEKLIEAYNRDKILSEKSQNPKSQTIIKYAFERHSTTRTHEERIREISEHLQSKIRKFPAPTGLYKVLQVVEKFKGFMSVRCGDTIVYFDYYSKRGKIDYTYDIKYKSKIQVGSSNKYKIQKIPLTNTLGTQFKFYFPLEIEIKQTDFPKRIEDQYSDKLNAYYINLNIFFNTENSDNKEIQIEQLSFLNDEIERIRNEGIKCLLIDVNNFDFLKDKNIINYLFVTLMVSQTENFFIVVLNLEKYKFSVIERDFLNYEIYLKEHNELDQIDLDNLRTLSVVHDTFNVNFLCKEETETKILSSLYNNPHDLSREEKSYVLINKHIIDISLNSTFRFNTNLVITEYYKHLKQYIQEKILTSENPRIFHNDKKILLPNKYYCEGFFETSNLLGLQTTVRDLFNWITILLFKENSDCIIIIGYTISNLFKQFEVYNYNISKYVNKIINISLPIEFNDVFDLVRDINDNNKILIITDVIGDGKTMHAFIEQLYNKRIHKIISLVNTNIDHDGNIIDNFIINKKQYLIDSIVEYGIKKDDQLPDEWEYFEIYTVNPKNNKLIIDKNIEHRGPEWKKVKQIKKIFTGEDIKTLENKLFDSNFEYYKFIYQAHYVNESNMHIPFYFDIIKLLNLYKDEMLKEILRLLPDTLKLSNSKNSNKEKSNYIVFPDYNKGISILANEIFLKIKNAKRLPLSNNSIFNEYLDNIFFKDEDNIIILDDAFQSGHTIERLIDFCSQKGAKRIFIIVLFRRANDFQARKFTNIKKYRESEIFFYYLIDCEIPTFNSYECPICQKIKELENVKRKIYKLDHNEVFLRTLDKISSNYVSENNACNIHDSRKENRKNSIKIRWMLEKALKDVNKGLRKELHIMLNNRLDDYSAIVIISHLSDEFYYFVDDYNDPMFFYNNFTNTLKKVCFYFILHPDKLEKYSTDFVDLRIYFDCLYLLMKLDEYFFIENIGEIIQSSNSIDKFNSVIIISLLSKLFSQFPKQALASYKLVKSNVINNTTKEMTLLSSLLKYLTKQIEQKNTKKTQLYKDYLQVRGFNHELPGEIKDLYKSKTNKNEFHHKWKVICVDLEDLLFELSNLISNPISSLQDFKIIKNHIGKMITLINDKIIQKANFSAIKKDIDLLINSLRDNEGLFSLHRLLRYFKVNQKPIIRSLIEMNQSQFEKKGIQVRIEFPNESLDTFCEEERLRRVFRNIIINVFKHSKCKNLLIASLIKDEEIITSFFDDGEGYIVEDPGGHGLPTIRNTLELYNGELIIIHKSENEKDYEELKKEITQVLNINICGYNKVIIVKMTLNKRKKEEL